MTLTEKIELVGLIGGGFSFLVYAGLQVWSNVIQRQAVAVSRDQTRVFEEQNEIMRAQGGESTPAPLHSLPSEPPVVVKARLWPLIPIGVLFLISLVAVLYDRYVPVVTPTAQSEIAANPLPSVAPTPYQYRGEISIGAVESMTLNLHRAFVVNSPITLVITSPHG
jgi:hypothetical protein